MVTNNPMKMADRIRGAIAAAGMTQEQLAGMMHIPKQNLSAMLNGRRPLTARYMAFLDLVLGMGVDYGGLVDGGRDGGVRRNEAEDAQS